MIVAVQRPSFAPYPGFFCAALAADAVVLLDGVQFPRGTTWVSRNRFKARDGELWLTIPVWKRGRGLQLIRDVEICREGRWMRKHLESLKAAYCHAPYLDLHLAFLETVYHRGHGRLVPFNLEILRHVWASVGLSSRLVLQSDVGVDGVGAALLARLCGALGADVLVAQKTAGNYLDIAALERAGIAVRYVNPRPIVYPQLWGPSRPNLSILDMLFTCGPAARRLLRMDQEVSGDGGAVGHAQGVSRDGPH